MRNIKTKRIKIVIFIFILIVTIMPFGYIAYSNTDGDFEKTSNIKPDVSLQNTLPNVVGASLDQSIIDTKQSGVVQDKIKHEDKNAIGISEDVIIDFSSQYEKEVDMSKVEVSKDLQGLIKTSDSKNSEKNIRNYKKVLSKFDVPAEYRIKLEGKIKEGFAMADILTSYDFLSDNYGVINELDEMLNERKVGKSFEEIFIAYNSTHPEFKPSNFDNKHLEELINTMSIDDIMIADKVSQKVMKKFDEVIALKQSGKTWKEIKSGLGIVNTLDKLPRMSLASSQVKKCMNDGNLSEEQAIEVLIITWKTQSNYVDVLKKAKSGKKKEAIFAENYYGKYK